LQAKGSLAETNLRSLLESAQAERATGTLTLRHNGEQPTTLYFLFGHLFHAVGEGGAGDDAVVKALGWNSGEFDFDAKAKLPADESVKASIPELLDKSPAGAPMPPPQPQMQSNGPSSWAPPPAQIQQPAPPPQAVPPPRPAPMDSRPPDPVNSRSGPYAPAPDYAQNARAPEPYAPPQQAPSPAARRGQGRGPQLPPPTPQPRRGLKFRPTPRYGREPMPTPYGELMYDSLKTSFVDFPRLLTTLEREGYTGYIRLLADDASGLIYFRDGTALECVFDAGQDPVEQGKVALQHFSQEVSRGQGVLDVVGLNPELVEGLFHVTVAQPIYSQLFAGWIDLEAFLQFLADRKLTGSLTVRARNGTGVIILDDGQLAGAYTSKSREVSNNADGVLSLCEDPEAMIEVKAASDAPHQPLDVSEVTGQRRGLSQGTWGQAPVSPPPAAPPPAAGPMPTAPPQAAPRAPIYTPPQPAPAPQPAPVPVPMPAPAGVAPNNNAPHAYPTPGQPGTGGADVEQLVAELMQMTDEALGNRARKVKDVLAAAERSRPGLESAIDQIPGISILFVDASRLESLSNDLRAKLHSYPL
jgi:hypothetical protein